MYGDRPLELGEGLPGVSQLPEDEPQAVVCLRHPRRQLDGPAVRGPCSRPVPVAFEQIPDEVVRRSVPGLRGDRRGERRSCLGQAIRTQQLHSLRDERLCAAGGRVGRLGGLYRDGSPREDGAQDEPVTGAHRPILTRPMPGPWLPPCSRPSVMRTLLIEQGGAAPDELREIVQRGSTELVRNVSGADYDVDRV